MVCRCGKTYRSKNALRFHQNYECGKGKNVKCAHCEHTSKRSSDMKKHFFNRHSMDPSLEFAFIKLHDANDL